MEVTTDPVELWASPNSRSRREKDYFDSKFGPFYRTAQVFIKPTSQENVMMSSGQLENIPKTYLIIIMIVFLDK